MPGRFEVLGHQPLVDRSTAPTTLPGADVARAGRSSTTSRPVGERILVVGMLRRDPSAMLEALARPTSATRDRAARRRRPRGIPAEDIAARCACARHATSWSVDDVGAAVDRALDEAPADDLVLVTGSLYVVGDARGGLVA